MSQTTVEKPLKLPEWFKEAKGKRKAIVSLSKKLQNEVPDSICQEARCPNRSECFAKGVLTFMIMGTVCTRNCGFCSVAHGKPQPVNQVEEANKILKAINSLNLNFVVITSPNRDDLKDGGAEHFSYITQSIRNVYPEVKVELLIPDLKGDKNALETIVLGNPHVLNHNVETVPSLYKTVRKGSLYNRSMDVLQNIKAINPKLLTKTGVMVGLGETKKELQKVFIDSADRGVDILTIGQYLKPDKTSLDVKKYYHPDEFKELKDMALEAGIRYVFSGPFVRSSYLADIVFEELDNQ